MKVNRKRRLYEKLFLLLIGLFVVIRMFTLVLSRYESESSSIANVDIAFYLLKEDYSQMSLNLASIIPRNNEYVYTFSIGNQDGTKTAEVDLEYDLTLRTTTNLPLTYELYMNEIDYTSQSAVNIIQNNTITQDDDGTFFRTMTTPKQTLYYNNPLTNVYQLVVHFPAQYNTEDYQDIIEALEIKVESKQLI